MKTISPRLEASRRSWSLFLSTAVLFLCIDAGATAPDWDQWRGPHRDGSAPAATWTDDLDDLERVWRVRLGKGYPGPLIVGDRVIVVETVDEETAGVRALRVDTGHEIWSRQWPSSGDVPFYARKNGDWVRSTPIASDGRVVVGDMREVLRSFDLETGNLEWSADLPERFGTEAPHFGFASSPLIVDGRLIVQGANSLVALDPTTGGTLWRSLETGSDAHEGGAFSSPVVAEIAGTKQLLVQARHVLHGVDPETGDGLWSREIENFRGMMILTPTVVGDAVFTSTYRGRSHLFDVSRSDEDGTFTVRERWNQKAAGYMSSPVVADGHAFLHLANGRVDCIDLETGESRWRTRESFGDYWSLAIVGDRILALDESGELILLGTGVEEPDVLDRRRVSDDSWAHLAVRGDLLVVRSLEAVELYRWRTGSRRGPG